MEFKKNCFLTWKWYKHSIYASIKSFSLPGYFSLEPKKVDPKVYIWFHVATYTFDALAFQTTSQQNIHTFILLLLFLWSISMTRQPRNTLTIYGQNSLWFCWNNFKDCSPHVAASDNNLVGVTEQACSVGPAYLLGRHETEKRKDDGQPKNMQLIHEVQPCQGCQKPMIWHKHPISLHYPA